MHVLNNPDRSRENFITKRQDNESILITGCSIQRKLTTCTISRTETPSPVYRKTKTRIKGKYRESEEIKSRITLFRVLHNVSIDPTEQIKSNGTLSQQKIHRSSKSFETFWNIFPCPNISQKSIFFFLSRKIIQGPTQSSVLLHRFSHLTEFDKYRNHYRNLCKLKHTCQHLSRR